VFEILIERTAEKDLRRLSDDIHDRVITAISTLSNNPRPSGAKKLVGSKSDWRIRVGDYRILYDIADTIRIVRVYRVRHRKDVYK
jgi:mRNA interferase RelE/StbE